MENITDALKMAGSVLIFVLALSITALAFSQARQGIDTILQYSDREYSTIKEDGRYYYLSDEHDTSRYVGKETIIPAIYRAYEESYKIVFKFPDNYYLFQQQLKVDTNNNYQVKDICAIDLLNESIPYDSSREFLDGIVYGKYRANNIETLEAYKMKFQITPNPKCLNDKLNELASNYKIRETLGTYYIEDLQSAYDLRYEKYTNDEISTPEVSEVNKTEKRVITYTFESK